MSLGEAGVEAEAGAEDVTAILAVEATSQKTEVTVTTSRYMLPCAGDL